MCSMEYNQIHFRAEFIIEEEKLEEYKKLIQEMSIVVEANEPDTINYLFYLNNLRQNVLHMKHTQIQRLYLLTLLVLHRKHTSKEFKLMDAVVDSSALLLRSIYFMNHPIYT